MSNNDEAPENEKPDENQEGKFPIRRLSQIVRKRWIHLPLRSYLSHIFLIGIIGLGGWVTKLGLETKPASEAPIAESPDRPVLQTVDLRDLLSFEGEPLAAAQINRKADVHTIIPTRPRLEIVFYEVQTGDSLFGIADNFGLKPETILWGNFDVLQDNPHSLQPGQQLNIAPVDGTIHLWSQGESLIGIADFFEVAARDIIDWPGNKINPEIDLEETDITPDTMIMIPGGKRDFVSWAAPKIPRSNPSVASIYGPGACGTVYDGPIGFGTFVWPTSSQYLSGYNYSPSTNHFGIDIGGGIGHGIFAVDAGVVVYSGWHNGGYGNVIVLDHGNGWQTLYAHLNTTFVGCGTGVFQGTSIGSMGVSGRSTGPHLHFEMLHDIYGNVNPWNYLP